MALPQKYGKRKILFVNSDESMTISLNWSITAGAGRRNRSKIVLKFMGAHADTWQHQTKAAVMEQNKLKESVLIHQRPDRLKQMCNILCNAAKSIPKGHEIKDIFNCTAALRNRRLQVRILSGVVGK